MNLREKYAPAVWSEARRQAAAGVQRSENDLRLLEKRHEQMKSGEVRDGQGKVIPYREARFDRALIGAKTEYEAWCLIRDLFAEADKGQRP